MSCASACISESACQRLRGAEDCLAHGCCFCSAGGLDGR